MKKKTTEANEFLYKGYVGSIEFSLTDNCLHGKVQGLSKMLLSYEGNTLEELKADFENCIDEYLEDCIKSDIEPQKPFRGTLNIRLNPELHRSAAMIANRLGTSLNNFIKSAIEHEINTLSKV